MSPLNHSWQWRETCQGDDKITQELRSVGELFVNDQHACMCLSMLLLFCRSTALCAWLRICPVVGSLKLASILCKCPIVMMTENAHPAVWAQSGTDRTHPMTIDIQNQFSQPGVIAMLFQDRMQIKSYTWATMHRGIRLLPRQFCLERVQK